MSVKGVVKKFIPVGVFKKIEPAGHLVEAIVLNALAGFPLRNLKVIGVTGTNGKTSTSFLIHKMLTEAGYNAGLMSTVAYGVGKDIQPQIAHMTSVSVPLLLKRVKAMKKQGMDWLVLETTSHALAQHRTWGVPFSIAVITNITHEHLDYHGTFENYVAAKRMLFEQTAKNKKGLQTGIFNGDDPVSSKFGMGQTTPHNLVYGLHEGNIIATKLKLTSGGSRFIARAFDEEYRIECHLPGSFNVSNALAAIGVGLALDLTKEQIEKGIAVLEGVEGRMTRVDEGQDFDVIVDFAHTPDSFEKLFKDLKPVVTGKLIVMFGSAGRRDEAKRAVQGQLAGEYCDEVVVTEEDDRDIDGVEIMNQIAEGAETAGKVREKDLFLVHDRTEAIKFTLGRAKKGDTVLLLGKGHEKTIERADGEHPWNEIDTTKKLLKNMS